MSMPTVLPLGSVESKLVVSPALLPVALPVRPGKFVAGLQFPGVSQVLPALLFQVKVLCATAGAVTVSVATSG
jgi:hypothetical protein